MCDHHDALPARAAAPVLPEGPVLTSALASARATRRTTIAGGGLLVAGALGGGTAMAAATPREGAARRSRLTRGTRLVHADMHNHTLLSDGDGDVAKAYGSMRRAGLDVAALTDHATLSDNLLGDVLTGILPPEYTQVAGLTPSGWAMTGALADAADAPGAYTAIRGFEWSEPLLGHVNVWFTEHYVDVLQAGLMQPLFEWLRREPGLVLDGGAGGLAGFNHPGREQGRFQEFTFDPSVRDQLVSLELFNRSDDYLFEGFADGRTSPLVACLGAGWRTGIAGVTDEHGTDWGEPEGKGRTGMWVRRHTRAGVKEAMRARRFFATRESGLRVDAVMTTREGVRRRMGRGVPLRRGPVRIDLDLDRGDVWRGKRLEVQVLRPGPEVPEVADVVPVRVGRTTSFRLPLDRDEGDWVVLRIADPTRSNATPGPDGHPANAYGVAYASPWWLEG